MSCRFWGVSAQSMIFWGGVRSPHFFIQKGKDDFPKLEAVFGFLDYFIQQNESLNSSYNHTTIREIKENLIKAIQTNIRTDGRNNLESSLVVHQDENVFWLPADQHGRTDEQRQ